MPFEKSAIEENNPENRVKKFLVTIQVKKACLEQALVILAKYPRKPGKKIPG